MESYIKKKTSKISPSINAGKQTELVTIGCRNQVKTERKFDTRGKEEQNNTKTMPKPPPATIYEVGVIQHIYNLL